MKIHDISLTTHAETITWDDADPGFRHEWTSFIGPDTPCNVSLHTLGAHTGTHLDAPLHFIAGGGTVAEIDIHTLVGPAYVAEILGSAVLTAADFAGAGIPEGTTRLILKTENTRRGLLRTEKFTRDYVGVAPDGAQWLVTQGIRLVGIDYLSIGPYGEINTQTHRILLGAGMVIVETLVLEGIAPGAYFLAALPPKFAAVEGSPCRVVLLEGVSF